MRTAGRFCALFVALLLAGSGAPTYLCAESTRPVCPPAIAHQMCHGDEAPQASIKCCCTLNNVPTQPPATDTAAPTLGPAVPDQIAYLPLESRQVWSTDATPQPHRNRDLPTLFSTFLL